MAQNLVVQLLLKTGTFSTDLKQAKGQIQNFQKGCQTASKSLSGFGSALGLNVGTLAKFGTVAGAAVLAGKEFKAILDSSQTTADAFQGAIAGCKGILEQFNTSMATADFSAFKDGLWGIYDAAKAVQDALDQLGNTQIAYDFMSKQNMTKFQEAYNIFKDPESTEEMKAAAKAQMKEAVDAQFQYAKNYSSSLYNTYVAQVVKKAGSANLRANHVRMSQFETAMKIDLGLLGDPEEVRARYETQYKEYLKLLKEYGKNNITGQNELKKEYSDVIAIHAMLELMKDDELKGVAQLIGGMEEAKQIALSMEKTYNRAMSSKGKATVTHTSVKAQKEELEIQKNSLTYWQNILNQETKFRDALVKGTEDWNLHNQKVEEAAEMIKQIQGAEEKRSSIMEGSVTWYNNMLSAAKKERDELQFGTDDWKKKNEEVKMYEGALKLIENDLMNMNLDDAMKIDPPTIESLQTMLSIFTQIRNTLPITSDEFKELTEIIDSLTKKLNEATGTNTKFQAPKADTWTEFNKAMSATSTIVNALGNTFKENSELTAASILQMVATSLPAIGTLMSSIAALTSVEAVEAGVGAVGKAVSTSQHWIEAIAAIASLGAAVAAALASAKSQATRFANGGIVGGSSFTGDRISAQVNSGEMILNRSQQSRLFRMANGAGNGAGEVTFHISGTDLVGVLNNQTRKNRIIG